MDNLNILDSRTAYKLALIEAAEIGAGKALKEAGLRKPSLKMSEANRLYGRSIVARWIKEGLIKPLKDGEATASLKIDRLQIEEVAKSANRSSFLTTNERNP